MKSSLVSFAAALKFLVMEDATGEAAGIVGDAATDIEERAIELMLHGIDDARRRSARDACGKRSADADILYE